MLKKIVLVAAMASLLLLTLNACGAVKENGPSQEDGSDIAGFITEINSSGSETVDGRIFVELEQPNNTSDKFWVTIEKNTSIYKYDGKRHTDAPFSFLAKGQNVEVWFDGPVAESYPAQVKAKQVFVRVVTDYDSLVDGLQATGATVEHETIPEVVVQDFFSATG
jgi:hypothetical protein